VLLLALTLNAARTCGERCEPFLRNRLATINTDPVRPRRDARERSVNLVEVCLQIVDNAFIELVLERRYSVVRTRAQAIRAVTITARAGTELLKIMGDPCTLSG